MVAYGRVEKLGVAGAAWRAKWGVVQAEQPARLAGGVRVSSEGRFEGE